MVNHAGQPFLLEIENVKVYYAMICLNYDSTYFCLTYVLVNIHHLLNLSINVRRTQRHLWAQGTVHLLYTCIFLARFLGYISEISYKCCLLLQKIKEGTHIHWVGIYIFKPVFPWWLFWLEATFLLCRQRFSDLLWRDWCGRQRTEVASRQKSRERKTGSTFKVETTSNYVQIKLLLLKFLSWATQFNF